MPETTGENEVPESGYVEDDFEPGAEGPEEVGGAAFWIEAGVLKMWKKERSYLAVYETPQDARDAADDGEAHLRDNGDWEDGHPEKERTEKLREMADEFEEQQEDA